MLAQAENPRATIGGNNPPDLREQLAEDHAQLRHDVEIVADRANAAPKAIKSEADLLAVGEIIKDAGKITRKVDQTRASVKEPHLTAGRDIDAYFKGLTDRLGRMVNVLQERATDYQRAKAAEVRREREEVARKAREEEDRQRAIAEAATAKNKPGTALRHEDRAEEAGERAARAEVAAQASAADLTRVRSDTGTLATSKTTWDFEIVDPANLSLEALRPFLARADLEKAIRTFVRLGGRELAGARIFENQRASFR